VLAFVAEGLSNKEIAARLYVSERTAKYQLSGLFTKLGVGTRAAAVAAAAQRGLL
jgi:DNA-binding NarL/FixJ family response regulator